MNTFEVTGKVYNIKQYDKLVTFGLGYGNKKQDGTWENCFLNIKIFKSMNVEIPEEKDKITVLGFFGINTYNGKTQPDYIATSVVILSKDGTQTNKTAESSALKKKDDESHGQDDDLPF